MLLPRLPVLSALLLFLLPAALLRGPGARAEGRVDGRSLLELVSRDPRTRAETAAGLGGVRALERGGRSHHGPEGHPKDPQYKKKFLMYLTGPLYFNPKCRKQFHRLYHNTRDCMEPSYYKRCARLLTQLAKSPRCTER